MLFLLFLDLRGMRLRKIFTIRKFQMASTGDMLWAASQ